LATYTNEAVEVNWLPNAGAQSIRDVSVEIHTTVLKSPAPERTGSMLKIRLLLASAALAVTTAGCHASPLGSEAGTTGPLFGGQTLGSGHRTGGDSTVAGAGAPAATTTASPGETDTRSGNLFGSGT
jgi:hypothetical protein